MRSLRITVPASRDLEAITDYFLEQSIDAGERFVQEFEQKCQLIARFPYIGKSYPLVGPDLRGLVVMNYIAFYRIGEDTVEILRVVSGYRDLRNIL